MTTNQKLREDMKRCVEAFGQASAERTELKHKLETAERQYRACAAASFLVVTALTLFIIVSDLVGW